MNTSGWIQLALYCAALAVITKPMGLYLLRVLDVDGKTWFDPILKPLERVTYRLLGVDTKKEHDWKQYTLAMLLFSLVSCLFTYAILRLQQLLPLNPQGLGALSEHLAFNTSVSFTTNTNWQSYVGEATMSYFSQMVRRPPASPSRRRSCAAWRVTRPTCSAISGWTWCASLIICCCHCVWFSPCSSFRKG
jgi:K+-transporting ATPase ATPase A chain